MKPCFQYPFLDHLLSPLSRRHNKTLALVISAIIQTGQARSFSIAMTLAKALRIRVDSAVNRFYRLLRNPRVDDIGLATTWLSFLARPRQGHLLLSIDWTEWHHDLRMLVAAMVTGKRAVPVFAQATHKLVKARSLNAYENTFLRVLADSLKRAKATATILCDRGFRRVSWIRLLQQLRLGFVVRLMDDVCVEIDGRKAPLRTLSLPRGKVVDLGVVRLRSDGAVQVRIIGYWAHKAVEPWWVATSDTGAARTVLKLYDRRMTVEEQFRDIKGSRFGVKLKWTHFRNPQALARLTLMLAIAVLVWLTTGLAAARKDPSLRMVCRKKGARQSYLTIGLHQIVQGVWQEIVTTAKLRHRLEPPHLRSLGYAGLGAAK